MAKGVAFFVLLVLLAALSFFMRGFLAAGAIKEFIYLTVAIILPVLGGLVLLVSAKTSKDYQRVGWLLKLIMLAGVLSIPAFYFFNR